MLPTPDVRDLEWFFGPQRLSQASDSLMGISCDGAGDGSTFGEQLERAALLYTGSDGKTVPPSGRMERVLHVVPPGEQGAGQLRMRLAPWPHIFVKKTRPPPPGTLPSSGPDPRPATDDQIAHVHAAYRARLERRERIAARLERVSGEEYSVLRNLYGALGLYWLNRPQGRLFALLALTRVGERHRNVASVASTDGGFSTARWLLEVAFAAPAPKWLNAARTQAEGLQRQAERAWRRTAPPRARAEAFAGSDLGGHDLADAPVNNPPPPPPPQPSTTLHNPPQTATGEQGALRSG